MLEGQQESVLAWSSMRKEPETRTWVQMVYLGRDCRKQE